MRIALITATPQSVREGSGTFVAGETLRRGLEALGHDVPIICPTRRAPPSAYTLYRFAFNQRLSPAAVHGAGLVVGFDMDGFRLAGRLSVPFVCYIHGMLADEARFERGLVAASMRLQSRAERAGARRADLVLTVSEYSRRRIVETYGIDAQRTAVVPPPLNLERWRQAAATAPKVSGDPPTVLSVGHLYRRKNFAGLIRAAALLRERVPEVRVRIVGDGPERLRLERQVATLGLRDCVRLDGQVRFDTLAQAYASCAIFCLPSLQEGFGLVCLEAMAAGKPVVCCRGTAVEELVRHGVNGLVVPPHDDGALAAALAGLLEDPAHRRQMGEAGRATCEPYGLEPGARRFMETVAPLTGGKEWQ